MPPLPSMFSGRWFDGRSALPRAVRLSFGQGAIVVEHDADGVASARHPLASVRVAEPLRHAPRLFDLPDGSVLQADETPALAAALAAAGHRESKVVGWQSAWPASLVALVLLIAGSAWLYVEGLPRAADWAAARLSPALEERMGDQVLSALDRGTLEASGLMPDKQAAIRKRLASFEAAASVPAARRLEFRSLAEGRGVNAFSLPGGTIELLDGLVDFTGNDDEMLLAVLAHEAGHQTLHHMTRSLFRALGGAALAGLLWGDYSSVASHTMILFGQLHYSRDDEREADDFAIAALRRAGISPSALARFFTTMQAEQRGRQVPDWASTHPNDGSRAQHALDAADADRDAGAASSPGR